MLFVHSDASTLDVRQQLAKGLPVFLIDVENVFEGLELNWQALHQMFESVIQIKSDFGIKSAVLDPIRNQLGRCVKLYQTRHLPINQYLVNFALAAVFECLFASEQFVHGYLDVVRFDGRLVEFQSPFLFVGEIV